MLHTTHMKREWRLAAIGVVALLAVQAAVLYAFGQPLICACGYIKFWEGVVQSAGNSQHITDWYTFSHIIHGLLFFYIVRKLLPRLSIGSQFLIALAAEIGWEILENTPWIIDRYREQALAQGYTGDSILNSVSDTLAMIAGYIAARKLPIWAVVLVIAVLEIIVALWIRDNLTLNVINLIYPFEFIQQWQAGI
jgi:hypothetical protein